MRYRSPTVAPDRQPPCLRRARPLLGTLVTLQLEAVDGGLAGDEMNAAADAAFAQVARVGAVMSAHDPASDLGRLARAAPGATLALDPHTVRVLVAARHWQRASRGAFDPVLAARRLARAGLRPAFDPAMGALHTDLASLRIEDECHVAVAAPVALDLGGIAKGYAVDLAVETLRARGVGSGLVNAGGDLRAFGPRRWPVELRWRERRASGTAPARPPRELHDAALATSQAGTRESEFVATARLAAVRRCRQQGAAAACCTVRAPDCMSADALTKWALQAAPGSTRLARALHTHRAGLWRLTT